ncbi:hypothetical protein ACQ4M3_09280 [Leptolyngbya sp. AN03gr2]|uniref:hypothetical protein n=1 Tax=Leptolyngbya sp. AN03gr2 TaxID=3423364 RepID=UPI003D315D7C
MFEPKLYLTAHGACQIAGSGVVVATIFLKPLTHPVLLRTKRARFQNNFEALEAYLDLLEEEVDYVCEYERIPVSTLERCGYLPTVSRVANKLGNRMRVNYSLNLQSFNLGHENEVWGHLANNYIRAEPSAELEFAECLARYFAGWWIKNHYHPMNPDYELDQNLGYATTQHLNTLLELGPDPRLHRSEGLKNLSRRWLDLIRDFDLWAMSQPYLDHPPDWWKRWFPDLEFTHCLTNQEVAYIRRIMQPRYEEDMLRWIRSEARAAGIPESAYVGFLNAPEINDTERDSNNSRSPKRKLL